MIRICAADDDMRPSPRFLPWQWRRPQWAMQTLLCTSWPSGVILKEERWKSVVGRADQDQKMPGRRRRALDPIPV